MDYGRTFSRAANIVWQYKFLILLGILASLAGGGGSASFSGGGGGGGGGGQPFVEPGEMPGLVEPGQMPEISGELAGISVAVIVLLVCVGLAVGILLWAIGTVARGGLIDGVNTVESGGKSGFGAAWGAGWQKVWTLLGIGILPAIPAFLLFLLAVIGFGAYSGLFALFGEMAPRSGFAGVGIVVALVACALVPFALALSILRTFAERAAMLEHHGVVDSYRRGWEVLSGNMGEAILLFILQLGLGLAVGLMLFLPGFLLALCCFLWPVLIAFQGAVTAFVSALWTLAWRTWTGGDIVEKAPA